MVATGYCGLSPFPPVVDPTRIDRFLSAVAELGGEFGPDRRLGVAVSGGPDSLALLLLAAAALPGRVAAATVDHGLRPEAAQEAALVASVCADLGVPHRILSGTIAARGSIQEEARRLRYRLLGTWAAEEALGALATAHHLDDQAETLLMRAVRGAGTAGLAGVRPRVTLADVPVPVIRPLLGWRRTELRAIVAAAGITPVNDPSNRDPAYDRTRFRALLAGTPLLRPEGLAAAAAHLGEAEEALAWCAERLAGDRLVVEAQSVRLLAAADMPRELRRRLVQQAIRHLAPDSRLRGDALDRLLRLLEAGRAATLAGVVARPGNDWCFAVAPPRADRPRNRVGSPGASIAINPDRLI